MALSVRPVETGRELRAFLRLPWSIYPGRYPHWVPPLLAEERKRLDRRRHPFFEHGDAAFFLAWSRGRPVGRIAAIENRLHNEFHGERVGFFGFFECADDPEAAAALVEAAADWCRRRNLTALRGPVQYSMNEVCGLLVDGFDDPPVVLMPYNPPYYLRLLEAAGFRKAKDLVAYEVDRPGFVLDRLNRLLERAARRHAIRIRALDERRFDDEIALLRDIYNASWERNWGFVPMTDREIEAMARELRRIWDPRLAFVGEVGGVPAGFALALPDVHQAIRHANGRWLPFGWARVWWHLRRIDRIRIFVLGVRPEYRRTGLDGLFYRQFFLNGVEAGYRRAESSWILEDNWPMRLALEKIGFRLYKTYRMLERPTG
jgi:GNAT superfamily N-acetyltransferase